MGPGSGFEWSFKPYFLCAKFFIGAPLGLNINKTESFFVFLLGCFILLLNLVINGPRGIDVTKFEWMENIQFFYNGWLYFERFPDALLQFVTDVTFALFFISISLIPFVFLILVLLSRRWANLAKHLKKMHNEMNLSVEFYQKCRRRCLLVLFIIVLVFVD